MRPSDPRTPRKFDFRFSFPLLPQMCYICLAKIKKFPKGETWPYLGLKARIERTEKLVFLITAQFKLIMKCVSGTWAMLIIIRPVLFILQQSTNCLMLDNIIICLCNNLYLCLLSNRIVIIFDPEFYATFEIPIYQDAKPSFLTYQSVLVCCCWLWTHDTAAEKKMIKYYSQDTNLCL